MCHHTMSKATTTVTVTRKSNDFVYYVLLWHCVAEANQGLPSSSNCAVHKYGIYQFYVQLYTTYSHSTDCSDTVWPFMVRSCTELLKSTSPSLRPNLTVDSAARFSQNFGTRANLHRNEEVWLKSFYLKSWEGHKNWQNLHRQFDSM